MNDTSFQRGFTTDFYHPVLAVLQAVKMVTCATLRKRCKSRPMDVRTNVLAPEDVRDWKLIKSSRARCRKPFNDIVLDRLLASTEDVVVEPLITRMKLLRLRAPTRLQAGQAMSIGTHRCDEPDIAHFSNSKTPPDIITCIVLSPITDVDYLRGLTFRVPQEANQPDSLQASSAQRR